MSESIISVDKITKSTKPGPLKAFVSIGLGGKMKIHDCRIIQQDGQAAWVSLPQSSFTGKDGKVKYYPIIEVSDNLKAAIQGAVLKAWSDGR
jgi:DNA-binding cell septation regulator SpoVG